MIWLALNIGSLVILTLYFIFSILVVLGWYKLFKRRPIREIQNNLSFSIILPMRNESENILKILDDINLQNYSKEAYELIIVDDDSEDNSWDLVERIDSNNIKLVKNKGEGKKSAILTGIEYSENEYIVQTDADCRLTKNWLSSINQYLNHYRPKLLLAPVIFEKRNTIFSHLQELDFFSIMMTTAGLTGIGFPVLANAANLIYPKELLKSRGVLNSKTCSGDDIFLLQYVKKEFGASQVHYLNTKEATITTRSSYKLKSFLEQRIRWASKSKFYKDAGIIMVGLLIAIMNFVILGFAFASVTSEFYRHLFIIAFVSKMFADYVLLLPILSYYKRLDLFIYFPFLSLLYPFYISFVGILSQWIGFEWKGRKY